MTASLPLPPPALLGILLLHIATSRAVRTLPLALELLLGLHAFCVSKVLLCALWPEL